MSCMSLDAQPDTPATHLMHAAAKGDQRAVDDLLPLVYAQLRAAAQNLLSTDRAPSLQATALVHDAYLRLVGPREVPWANRAHFYAAAAQAMRRILIDHARARARRGPRVPLHDLPDLAALVNAPVDQIVAVDDALTRLEVDDPQAGLLVRLRFYAGLDVDQAAMALNISPRTAARLWQYARARLMLYLQADPPREP